ncbi:MAG: hypothetical protein U0905_11225 [Pirellulales bacterium]
MGRQARFRHDEDFAHPPRRKKRRFKKRYILLALCMVGLLGVAIGVPYVASNRSFVVSMANRYAGIAPNRIDLDRIQVSWFSPVRLEGVRLLDERGSALVQVGSIQTDKGLLGFAMNSKNVGTITIKDSVVQVDVQPGTTNIEEAIRPLMQGSSSGASSSGSAITGNVQIENAIVKLLDTVDLQAWEVRVQSANVPLPSEKQPIPMVTAAGMIQPMMRAGQAASTDGICEFAMRLEPSTDAVQVNAGANASQPIRIASNLKQFPLQLLGLAKRRMPELPFERIQGKASLQADMTMLTPSSWIANITEAKVEQLQMIAPTLVGAKPASMQQLVANGKITFSPDRVVAERARMVCDVGDMAGNIALPLPVPMPTAMQPWIDRAELDMQGTIDMAQLVKAMPGLITMQEQTQLLAGKASMHAMQKMQNGQTPIGQYSVKLGDLVANVNGTTVNWKDALGLELSIQPGSQPNAPPQFSAKCLAEFCELNGVGSLQGGEVKAQVDLDKMQQRLSTWFVLPFSKLSGNATCNAKWSQDANQRLLLNGTVVTSPMNIGLPAGALNEPAWNGAFEVLGRITNNAISQIDRAQVNFTSAEESLLVKVLDPISLVAMPTGMQPLPPAGIALEMKGDLGAWQKRGQMFAGVDPGMDLGGRCRFEAKGQMDMRHVEVLSANFSAQPLMVRTNGMVFQEPQVIGDFTGRVDSQALARLQVDKLNVTSSSFGISAMDAPAPQGNGRQGKAAFRIDPKRLMASMESQASAAPPTFVEGDVQGAMNWTIDTTSLTWQLETNGKDLRVVQMVPATPSRSPGNLVSTSNAKATPSLLWNEPAARATMVGRYNFATGAIDLPESQFQTEWLAYAGQTTIASTKDKTQMVAKGQMSYDASRVAERLRPWIGSYLQIQGQRTEPVEVTWVSSTTGSWANSLQARTNIGWDAANVVGIEVGKSEIPITIENGHFKSKTEIPVSQGAMRWNLDGDLAKDTMVITQAPEVVLDNVAITPMMCQGWLKYVAPLLAEATKVQGKLSLRLDDARIVPTDIRQQRFAGQLQLHGATVGPGPLADQLVMVAQQIKALRKGTTAASATASETWLQLPAQNVDFSVDSGRVVHKNLQFAAGDVIIQTSGEVAIDGQIQMVAAIPIQKDWIDSTPMLASLADQSIQLPIQGTLQRPQVDFSKISNLAAQAVQGAAQGMLQKQMEKGFNKILGPMQQGLQNLPFPQGILPNNGGNAPSILPSGQ